MLKYFIKIILLFIAFFLSACAQIGTISGGEKDVQPPQIQKQIPENNSTNFSDNIITISFNEYVELVNPQQTFRLSPTTTEHPQYSLKGKNLIIDFKDCDLQENTTYILTCEKGIKDFTEGNFFPSTHFIFSTGNYIDSMMISGNIKDVFNDNVPENINVFLYTENKDSSLINSLPKYITKTDKDGNFCFTNLPNREFYISALIDKNSNNLFDQTDEAVAFIDSTITPQKPIIQDSSNLASEDSLSKKLSLNLFVEQDTTLKFLKREFVYSFLHRFIFKNKKVENFDLKQISSLDTAIRFLSKINSTHDTVLVFFLDTTNEVFDFEIYANNILMDTISINPNQKTRLRQRQKKEQSFIYFTTKQNGDLFCKHIISFNYPISHYKNDKFLLVVNNDTLSDTISVGYHFIDSIQQDLMLDYDFKDENKTYTFLCPDSVFFNHFNWHNDSINFTIKTSSFKDFGNLQISYQFYEENNFIAELLNDKNIVIQTDKMTFNKQINYEHLLPGKYRLRIIVDENNNGYWDSGIYLQRKQPEKVIYFPKTIEIPANWNIEETFDVVIQ